MRVRIKECIYNGRMIQYLYMYIEMFHVVLRRTYALVHFSSTRHEFIVLNNKDTLFEIHYLFTENNLKI